MKNSKSCYSRLLFGVMTFNQQRKFILAAEKNLLFSIKTLSLCFFLEGFFLFFDLDCQNLATLGFDNCPISENGKSLAEKATSALSFSTSEEVFSSCQEQLFPIGIRTSLKPEFLQFFSILNLVSAIIQITIKLDQSIMSLYFWKHTVIKKKLWIRPR